MRTLMMCTSSRHEVGGMEGVFRSVAEALRGRGHNVSLVYTESADEQIDERTWALRLEPPRTRWRIPTPASMARMVASLASVARLLRRVRPDVVNVHFITAQSLYFYLLRPFFGYTIVLSAHGSDLMRPVSPVDRVMLPRLLRLADAVTVVSKALADRAVAMTAGKGPPPVIIPNGVDLAFWSPAEVGTNGRANPIVVTVVRLHPVKGHDVLLKAMERVHKAVPTTRLKVVGGGEGRAATEALAQGLGLTEWVDMLGNQPPPSVRSELRGAAVFALPSRSEGMPISLLEAMATGCAVVATRVGGVPEVLANGDGLVVPPEDPSALAEAIIQLLCDPSKRAEYAARARRRAADFSWATSAAAYSVVISEARPVRMAPEGSGRPAV